MTIGFTDAQSTLSLKNQGDGFSRFVTLLHVVGSGVIAGQSMKLRVLYVRHHLLRPPCGSTLGE
jgi:hypothetical protein